MPPYFLFWKNCEAEDGVNAARATVRETGVAELSWFFRRANGPFDVVLLGGALNAIEHAQQWGPVVDFLRGIGGEIAALYPGLEPARAIHELVRRLIAFFIEDAIAGSRRRDRSLRGRER